MFILRDLLTPLQEEFPNTKQGQKGKNWFSKVTDTKCRLCVQSSQFLHDGNNTHLTWVYADRLQCGPDRKNEI